MPTAPTARLVSIILLLAFFLVGVLRVEDGLTFLVGFDLPVVFIGIIILAYLLLFSSYCHTPKIQVHFADRISNYHHTHHGNYLPLVENPFGLVFLKKLLE